MPFTSGQPFSVEALSSLLDTLNHLTLAQGRYAQYLRQPGGALLPNVQALTAAEVGSAQTLEGVFLDLVNKRVLPNATAAQLDVLGRIVVEARDGLSDADYRAVIGSKIKINRSSGTIEDIYGVFLSLLPSGGTMSLVEHQPASFVFTVNGAITAAQSVLFARFVNLARAAGVGAALVFGESTPLFQFDALGGGFDVGHFAGAI